MSNIGSKIEGALDYIGLVLAFIFSLFIYIVSAAEQGVVLKYMNTTRYRTLYDTLGSKAQIQGLGITMFIILVLCTLAIIASIVFKTIKRRSKASKITRFATSAIMFGMAFYYFFGIAKVYHKAYTSSDMAILAGIFCIGVSATLILSAIQDV